MGCFLVINSMKATRRSFFPLRVRADPVGYEHLPIHRHASQPPSSHHSRHPSGNICSMRGNNLPSMDRLESSAHQIPDAPGFQTRVDTLLGAVCVVLPAV